MRTAQKIYNSQDITWIICIRAMRQCSYFSRAFLVLHEGISLRKFFAFFVTQLEVV